MTAVHATASMVEDRYRLGEVLGVGAAGVVRLAHDERLGRHVAIKLFHPGTTEHESQTAELALMAGLAHPALVTVYDGGHDTDANGTQFAYLVMEHVAGQTLRRALDERTLSPADIVTVGRDIASALTYLAALDVVHRDVKPANVLLRVDGDGIHAKLGDFGPARGDAAGPAGDVYSLGLVLLEALSGTRAYGPPVVPARLGPQWVALLSAMLDTDPLRRPTALQVRTALATSQARTPAPQCGAAASRHSRPGWYGRRRARAAGGTR